MPFDMSAAKLAIPFAAAVAEIGAGKVPEHWVASWTAAPQELPDKQAQHFDARQTIRMMVHATLGGPSLRVRISNLYGKAPLDIGAAHIALRADGPGIDPRSDRTLTFGRRASVIVAPHDSVLSDPVSLNVPAEAALAVSLYLPKAPATRPRMRWRVRRITQPPNPGT